MPKLNLTELSELHATRRMWMRGRHREDLCGRCRMVYPCPTRQLLDLVDRMGEALRVAVPNLQTATEWREDDPEYRQIDDAFAGYQRAKGEQL